VRKGRDLCDRWPAAGFNRRISRGVIVLSWLYAYFPKMLLLPEVYFSILENLSRGDLDTMLVTNRQLGSLSRRVSRGWPPRPVSLAHVYAGYFDLRFDEKRRYAAFTQLPRYLESGR